MASEIPETIPETKEAAGITQSEEFLRPKVNFFVTEDGLRSGWRLLVYFALLILFSFVLNMAIGMFAGPPNSGVPGVWPQLWQEVGGFAVAFGVAMIMSRIERRPLGVYGLPGSELFGKKFWLGFLFGLLEVTLLVGLISAFDGYSFGTLALRGSQIPLWALFHLVMFTFVGLFEEFLFRGYTQFTLGDGIGFWPAAFVLSFLFGGTHLFNPGEGIVGAVSVVLIGLLWCFTVRRTGSLWYAVGMHASFDWGETYLYSVPNSGTFMEGHLSNAVVHAGPNWLTGGTVGPEGSVFCFLTIALQFLVVLWLFPAKKNGAADEAELVEQ